MISSAIPRRFRFFARLSVAQAVTFVLFILSLCAFSIPHAGEIRPFFLLMAVYYWCVFRPTLLPPAVVFTAGLLIDFFSGLPAGLTAGILVMVQWIVRSQRRYLMGQSYVVLWTGFAIVCFSSAFVQWGLFGLTRLSWPPVEPILAGAALSVFLFPPVAAALQLVHRILPEENFH